MNPTKDILLKEKNNRNFIYLYPHRSRAWVAYGQSAIHLNRLLPHIFMIKLPRSKCGAVMVVDRFSIEWLFHKLPPLNRSKERILLQMPEELLIYGLIK